MINFTLRGKFTQIKFKEEVNLIQLLPYLSNIFVLEKRVCEVNVPVSLKDYLELKKMLSGPVEVIFFSEDIQQLVEGEEFINLEDLENNIY